MLQQKSPNLFDLWENNEECIIPDFLLRNSYNNRNSPNIFEPQLDIAERSKSHFPFLANFVPKLKPMQTNISPSPMRLRQKESNDINEQFSLSFQESSDSDFEFETDDSEHNSINSIRKEMNKYKNSGIVNNSKYQDFDEFLREKERTLKCNILEEEDLKNKKVKKESIFTKAIKSFLEEENMQIQKTNKGISLLKVLETSLSLQA